MTSRWHVSGICAFAALTVAVITCVMGFFYKFGRDLILNWFYICIFFLLYATLTHNPVVKKTKHIRIDFRTYRKVIWSYCKVGWTDRLSRLKVLTKLCERFDKVGRTSWTKLFHCAWTSHLKVECWKTLFSIMLCAIDMPNCAMDFAVRLNNFTNSFEQQSTVKIAYATLAVPPFPKPMLFPFLMFFFFFEENWAAVWWLVRLPTLSPSVGHCFFMSLGWFITLKWIVVDLYLWHVQWQ